MSTLLKRAVRAVAALVPAGSDVAVVLCVQGDTNAWQGMFACTGNRERLAQAITDLAPEMGRVDAGDPPAPGNCRQHSAFEPRTAADRLPELVETTQLIPFLRTAIEDAAKFRKANDILAYDQPERTVRLQQLETLGRFVDLLEGK